jgi:hypothetical protein
MTFVPGPVMLETKTPSLTVAGASRHQAGLTRTVCATFGKVGGRTATTVPEPAQPLSAAMAIDVSTEANKGRKALLPSVACMKRAELQTRPSDF